MPQIDPADYEALTVAELKEIADSIGVEIPHDARKAEIIEILAKTAKKEGLLETPPAEKPAEKDAPEQQDNVYTRQMNSTETALVTNEYFWKTKLHS
jgi:Rho termination factor, N-terminal domain